MNLFFDNTFNFKNFLLEFMMNFQNAPIVSSFSISTTATTTIDNQIKNNLIGRSLWLPHLPSKFKDKQILQKEKLKLIAKKK
ncbi:unnamed protein product [Rotaria sp. Silwood1]|nr:unnamed protein product [Rotaria sp. Silwood1]